jgi:hypothetical protein
LIGDGALAADADHWMAAEGIREPARFAAMLVPGFTDPMASDARGRVTWS